jgi:hypothetical protein
MPDAAREVLPVLPMHAAPDDSMNGKTVGMPSLSSAAQGARFRLEEKPWRRKARKVWTAIRSHLVSPSAPSASGSQSLALTEQLEVCFLAVDVVCEVDDVTETYLQACYTDQD